MVSKQVTRRFPILFGLSLVLVLIALAGVASAEGGRPLFATLLGANEVLAADPDGSGAAVITLNQGQGTVCWSYAVENIAAVTAAHIHRAPAGIAGPVVVPLRPAGEGFTPDGCIENVDQDLIKEIRQNPEGFYVNVHNAEFPAGALRGQLEKPID